MLALSPAHLQAKEFPRMVQGAGCWCQILHSGRQWQPPGEVHEQHVNGMLPVNKTVHQPHDASIATACRT